jgi:cobalt-zinc-cadmium resistance protein CzcA
MIHGLVKFALKQRFLILMLVVFITVGGAISFQRMPVDAYPDLSPPMVEIITQWPGHAAEEVERLVTLPTEVEMNGVPKMLIQRSISLYGLSDVILTFDEDTDDYFARQVVFQRLSEVAYPAGVTPTLAPLSSPSGLVYRYVLESPDRTPQELKTFEDWVIEREYKQVRGVADDSGFGGTVMQYQVLLDPARLYGYHITVPQVLQQLSVNNANTGGGFYSQGGQFYYVRGLGLIKDEADIGSVIIGSQNGVPVHVRDVGDVVIGHAPRLGQFGFNKNDDAVEGVIMMLRGDQTQNVLKGVRKNQGAERAHSAAGCEGPTVLRSQRFGAADHRYGGRKHGAGHDAGADRADFLPGQRARGGDRGLDDSPGPALLVHFSARARRRG